MSTVFIQSKLARRIALTVCVCLVPTSVLAQDAYPNRAIKIIAPVGAGSVADLVPRLIADKLATRWGNPVFVENRPGGNTNIGAETAARAEPDGHTLLAAPATTLAVNPSLFPKLAFDLTAFVPVTVLADEPNVLVANPKLPFSTVQELIAFAKANPGKLTYASPGVGSVQHLSVEMLASMSGISLVHVPYKDLPEAVNDVVAGHVDLLFDNLGSAAPLIKSGNLKAIAVGSERRNAFLPDLPSVSEAVPGFRSVTWFAIVAPPRTPAGIAEKLSAAIAGILKTADVTNRFRDLYATPVGSSPADTAAFFAQERERWRSVIVSAGIKVE
ncbi:MAG: tripartite tricarboxylate transporter substrate binding protein [Xanthobacteraceae bacterium]